MAIVTDRALVEGIIQDAAKKKVSIALFCTASTWNNEAILKAAQNFGRKHGIKNVPIIAGFTGSYKHMPQLRRTNTAGNLKAGFNTILGSLDALCGKKDSPYYDVMVMPQLDHGDPVKDKWIFEEGIERLAGVMFDCQSYSYDENVAMTKKYCKEFGGRIMVESAMEQLAVLGNVNHKDADEHYVERAVSYMKETGADFIVADLGTEQQSTSTDSKYLKERARMLTQAFGKEMLVLHGVSSLKPEQIVGLGDDGVVKVNMWTRIVREAGIYAYDKLSQRKGDFEKDFNAVDPQIYMNDLCEYATNMMEEHLGYFNYANLAK
ncbi:MAG: class II fructose-bisphosphate aldolase [Christensenellaceae bacterium]